MISTQMLGQRLAYIMYDYDEGHALTVAAERDEETVRSTLHDPGSFGYAH
ncbi:hypothetical protein [Pseudomonas sp. MWU12-2323]|nr:hypothetical protein [Pseudomonas sp. MWU12-2323]